MSASSEMGNVPQNHHKSVVGVDERFSQSSLTSSPQKPSQVDALYTLYPDYAPLYTLGNSPSIKHPDLAFENDDLGDEGAESWSSILPAQILDTRHNSMFTFPSDYSLSNWDGFSFTDVNSPRTTEPGYLSRVPTEDIGISAVSDDESVHENQLQEGQTYFKFAAERLNEADVEGIIQPRHWNDPPMYPYAVSTTLQPASAAEAMQKFNERADDFSMVSRTATWGSRRRSEPSLADMESVIDGTFLKKLSISKGKEKSKGHGPERFFNASLDQLTNLVQRKGDGKKVKRYQSELEFLPPLSLRKSNSDGLHSDNPNQGDASEIPFKKKRRAFVKNLLKRKKSKSEGGQDLGGDNPGIAGMWSRSGGPPIPRLFHQPFKDSKKQAEEQKEGEEEDEEVLADEVDKIEFTHAIPIIPNFTGFREQVLRLNPKMESVYLVDRIAHHQVVRYKKLVMWRVKHQSDIQSVKCKSGSKCMAQVGTTMLFDSHKKKQDSAVASSGLNLDPTNTGLDPDGKITSKSFPPGMPMPSSSTLPAEFECQLCFCVKNFKKPPDWTKHVYEDLEPFTCTYEECRESKPFKRKADWAKHENERHRHLEWWICNVKDCTHGCFRKEDFIQHLIREHKLPEPKIKNKAAVKNSRGGSDERFWATVQSCRQQTTAKPQDEPCRFCGTVLTSWKSLKDHLAKHLEHISLPLLELINQELVDENANISLAEPSSQFSLSSSPLRKETERSRDSAYFSQTSSMSPLRTSDEISFGSSMLGLDTFDKALLNTQTRQFDTVHHNTHFGLLGFNAYSQIHSNHVNLSPPDSYHKLNFYPARSDTTFPKFSSPEVLGSGPLFTTLNINESQQKLTQDEQLNFQSFPANFVHQYQYGVAQSKMDEPDKLSDPLHHIPGYKYTNWLQNSRTMAEEQNINIVPKIEVLITPPAEGQDQVVKSTSTKRLVQSLVEDKETRKLFDIEYYNHQASRTVNDSRNVLSLKNTKPVLKEEDKITGEFNDQSKMDYTYLTQRLPSTPENLLSHNQRAAPDLDRFGKASPFSSPSQGSEDESGSGTESELTEDEGQADEPSCRSHFNERQQDLYEQILLIFWNIWNQNCWLIVLKCAKLVPIYTSAGSSSNCVPQQKSTSSDASSSTTIYPSRSFAKRKHTEDDDNNDEFPPGDRDQGSQQPKGNLAAVADEGPNFRFACPFRKYSPQKYNMHHPNWKACAISSFESVARTKEHLYRKHKAPIQCVRCWIFFQTQDDLDIHIAAKVICALRVGQPVEGITPAMVLKLKSRKKSSMDQTEEARWGRMYKTLFPNAETPSPFFEPVLDDLALLHASAALPVEEFVRQNLPQFLSRRLETEILNMGLDNDTGTLDQRSRLQEFFTTRIPSLVNEAVEDVSSAYRQRSSGDPPRSNSIVTPPSSYTLESTQTPLSAIPNVASHRASLPSSDSNSSSHNADPLSSRNLQYIDAQISESDRNSTQGYGLSQIDYAIPDLPTERDAAWNTSNDTAQPPDLEVRDILLDLLAPFQGTDNTRQNLINDSQLSFDWADEFERMYDTPQGVPSGEI
jgi:hypothetical protein